VAANGALKKASRRVAAAGHFPAVLVWSAAGHFPAVLVWSAAGHFPAVLVWSWWCGQKDFAGGTVSSFEDRMNYLMDFFACYNVDSITLRRVVE
jgi:hypothetical protein